ncbi:MAG: xanthine dehydrogenase family protein subunit M [Acidobacteriota bacterium]|nr:xanthine dehydrogenase family protein subunit M [Acidobacteriota bacterium]
MNIEPLLFHRPESLKEAFELGRSLGGGATFLAGGTELVPDFRRGREAPSHVISLSGLSELRGIELRRGQLRVGALVTIEEICESAAVREWLPSLAEAASLLASPQIRNLATIGGNFCRAVPCADTPPVCIAAGSHVVLVSERGARTLPAEQLFTGPRQTVLEPGELLREISIPAQPDRSGGSYQRFAHRRGSALAVAAVAARVVLDGDRVEDARIVLGAVGPTPLMAHNSAAILSGAVPSDEAVARAAKEAAGESEPISDLRGSAEFRRQLVEVLTARALRVAIERARIGGSGPGDETRISS